MRIALVAVTAVLAGCALNVKLLEDGKAHAGNFDVAAGTMEVVIDGDRYAGRLSRGTSAAFFTGMAGTRLVTGTSVIASDQFQAVLTNSAGRVLRCQFQSALGRGTGLCQNNEGRTFDLVQ